MIAKPILNKIRKRNLLDIKIKYECGIKFSADGQFIASGDAEGKVWFWQWKTCKNVKTIDAHESVCIDLDFHPIESSKVVTCSWDSSIKLWD